LAAGIVGLVALAFVTRKLRRMRNSVMAFKEGDYSQRVVVTSNDELDDLGAAFNEMASTIQKNVEQLNNADALRRELIANVSHDLRTPLAAIQGYLETLMMKESSLTDEERQRFLKTTFNSTERLGKLVQELFELSKLEAKQSQPKPEPFSLPELVNDVTMKFGQLAERSGVKIAADIPKSLPLAVADIGMIERALQNLVENALNHTPSGGRITIALARRDGKLAVTVEDTGVGIAEKDLPHIFERFFSVRSRTQPNRNGAGLGLAITKKILEAHQQVIHVQSHVNEGTRFMFELPALR
jgi:signal transduction histidine kinase